MANQILVIAPYWLDSVETWVFDDEAVDLVQEPFVSGVPEMIDELVGDIPDAQQGFRLLFSAAPFPGFQRKLTRVREEFGGWWYLCRSAILSRLRSAKVTYPNSRAKSCSCA